MSVICVHREPFAIGARIYRVPEGQTLADMVKRVRSLPDGWPRHDHDAITIDGHVVPRCAWGSVKPHAMSRGGVPVQVEFHAPPMGGEGGGDKNPIATVAALALTAVSGGIASGAILGGLTGATAAGGATFLSRIVAGGVLLLGSAAVSALSPSPTQPQRDDERNVNRPGTAGANGNVLEPNAAAPRVVGTRKIFPPHWMEPLVYFDGDDEVVEALVALAGPHKIEDVRVGGAPIADLRGVEFETSEGWPGSNRPTITRRYGRTRQDGTNLRGHTVTDQDGQQLEASTGDLDDAIPQPKVLSTRDGQDEFWIGLTFPQGLVRPADDDDLLRVPFRLRMREIGATTWINLPELHYIAAKTGEKRTTIVIKWRDGEVTSSAASTRGWTEARIVSPAQTLEPATTGWTADTAFDKGSGDDYVSPTNVSAVKNVIMSSRVAEITLDENTFPRGQYEFEVTRGFAFRDADYSASGYTIGGSVRDPFNHVGGRIHQTRDGLADRVVVVRTSSVWNQNPMPKGGTAYIAMRAPNTQLSEISTLASGYVRGRDGSAWTDWKITSNPAPHMRDVLSGMLNKRPVPPEIVDDQELMDWSAAGWTCDAILEGTSVREAARIIAGSGRAKLRESETYGVVRDYDRSAEAPVQVFSPRNMHSFSFDKGFAKLPDGFRATFVDKNKDYESRQIIHPEGADTLEQVEIEGLVTEADVRARLDYDLANARLRSTFYSFTASPGSLVARRGSLIGVNSDVLDGEMASGLVVDLDLDGSGDVTALHLEYDMPEETTGIFGLEKPIGIVIRRSDLSITTHRIASVTGSKVVLDTPTTRAGLEMDNHAMVGPLDREFRRLIVFDMQIRPDFSAEITAVPEAPEIWQ